MIRAYGLALLLAAGCTGGQAGQTIPNPSGSCAAASDGSRAGYHSAQGSTWLPDCQNTLRREYWRVFATDEDSAYTIPRIDGDPLLAPVCQDRQHALAALAAKYPICASAESAAQVERVNDMAPEDAQALTRFLHTRLRFTLVVEHNAISPFPMPTDVLDACALRARSAALEAICASEKSQLQNGREEVRHYAGPGAVELVDRLNELYGVPR